MAYVATLTPADTMHKEQPNGVIKDDVLHYFKATAAGGTGHSTGATRASWPIPATVGDDNPITGECELLDTAGFTSDGRLVATYLFDTGAGWELRAAVFGKAKAVATGQISLNADGNVLYLNRNLGGVVTQAFLFSLMSDPSRLAIVASGTDGFYHRLSHDMGATWSDWVKFA